METASHIPEGRVWQTFRLYWNSLFASSHVTLGKWPDHSAPLKPDERMWEEILRCTVVKNPPANAGDAGDVC